MVTRLKGNARTHLYIDEWMAKLGLTDEILAGRMETNRVTMWRWRTQQHRLNPQKIAAIAAAMDLQPEQLWRLPDRPSVDAILRDAPDEAVQRVADVASIMLKTGT